MQKKCDFNNHRYYKLNHAYNHYVTNCVNLLFKRSTLTNKQDFIIQATLKTECKKPTKEAVSL
jgi:hypothetical protein